MAHSSRFFCEICQQRYPDAGDCPQCVAEPLLDLADDEVRIMLDENAARARMRRYSIILGIVIVATMPLSFALVFFVLGIWLGIPAASVVVFGLTALCVKLFPSKIKAPQVSDEELAAFRQ